MGFLDNNIIFFGVGLIAFIYDIYSMKKKIHCLHLIIDDRKKNIIEANRVSLIYKVKFLLYTLLTMFSISLLILKCFGSLIIIKNLKIYNK